MGTGILTYIQTRMMPAGTCIHACSYFYMYSDLVQASARACIGISLEARANVCAYNVKCADKS